MNALAPIAADTPACTCPNCGAAFPPGGRGLGRKFCSAPCRKAFHQVNLMDGAIIAPLVKAWHKTRHAKPGTREAAICTFARNQLTQITGLQLDADEEAGRDSVAYVGTLMDSGTLYIDRTRK